MMRILGIRRPPQIPQTILFHTMKARENPRVYMHVEAAWVVSCVNALGYAPRQAPSRSIYTTSTPGLDLDLDHDLGIGIGIDLVTNRGRVGGGTVAMVTVAPIIVEITVIIRLLIASAATSIGQQQLEREKLRITML